MKEKRKRNRLFISVLILLFISITLTTCKFPENSSKEKITSFDNEQEKIAAFLVKSTEINLQIMYLCKTIESNSKAVKIKDAFQNQMQLTSEIHNKIKTISESKLVNIPLLDKNLKLHYSNDSDVQNLLLNELNKQIIQFERINDSTNDYEILSLKSEFLPKLISQSEKINSLKINI